MAYDGERADAQLLDQLEAVLRLVADELGGWRARALKAEAEFKEAGLRAGGAASGKPDVEARGRLADLEQENKVLRQRVEAARLRVHDLLSRLTFLEEQARESGGNGGPSASGSSATGARGAGGASGPGGSGGVP